MATPAVPEDHPPVDWSKWEAAGEDDVRSPCPMLNALANHHILPHSGRGITEQMAIDVLTQRMKLDIKIAKLFASVAITANPEYKTEKTFDLHHLRKHGLIEHDVSLSRSDINLQGDNYTFDKAVWDGYLKSYGDAKTLDFASASRARFERVLNSKQQHSESGKAGQWTYGAKEFVLSYGETALLMGVLGDAKEGKIPIEYLRVLVENERIPYQEGWRPSEKIIAQSDMNHLILSLAWANDRKLAEAGMVGWGTVFAVKNAITNTVSGSCTIM